MTMNDDLQTHLDVVAPTLESGHRWLFDTAQPGGALVRPGGVTAPAIAGRRFTFVPAAGRRSTAAIVVRPDQTSTTRAVTKLRVSELDALAAQITDLGTAAAAVSLSKSVAVIRTMRRAHPSLITALARFQSGCPVHQGNSCGVPGAQPCEWITAGFQQLILPDIAVPPPIRTPPVAAAVRSTKSSSTPVPGLLAGNRLRQAQGAQRAIAAAAEAVAAWRRSGQSDQARESLQVLQLRIDHPDLTLRELAELHTPPVTKDAYASRLRRALAVTESHDARKKQINTAA